MRESVQTHARVQIEMRDSLRIHKNLHTFTDGSPYMELSMRARVYRIVKMRQSLYIHENLHIEMRESLRMHESLDIYR